MRKRGALAWALAGAIGLGAVHGAAAAQAAPAADARTEPLRISGAALYDRVYASWLGQLAGNIYGLPHENIHIDEPGPDGFPYGYDRLEIPYYKSHFAATRMTGVMDAFGGAFSDDDTDIEYIYLQLMEQAGIEPSYAQIRDAWMGHVDDWVWIANRQALALMHYGYAPPYTGRKAMNAEWFQIDPQLINEIWAITAPGMVGYASAKSLWGARVSADDWGTEPTVAYGAMFAAAFFEPDVAKLVDIGLAALPADAKFARTIVAMKALHRRYPDDWRAARREMARDYYLADQPKSIWSANLNGACAILALLYGAGDFQKTMDLASAMGFDADNQAATLGGLLGVAQGTKGIPASFLYPVKGWTLPFNDRYLNRSRRDMPSAAITDMARRTVALAEKIILANGGRKIVENGETVYLINRDAAFAAPFELAPLPATAFEAGAKVFLPLYAGDGAIGWRATGLPPGLGLGADGIVQGVPTRAGVYRATISATRGGEEKAVAVTFTVNQENLARRAAEILGPETLAAAALEALRDGKSVDGQDVATPPGETRLESFGYRWAQPVQIAGIVVTTGRMTENGGWMTSLSAEYRDARGDWAAIPHVAISPEPVLSNDKQLRPHYARYAISFPPLSTSAVRIKALNGGDEGARHISLSEIAVFAR